MCEHASHVPLAEAEALKTRIADLEALLAGTEHTLRYEQESARRVESQYHEAKTNLNKARDVFDVIWQRGNINLDEDSDYADLATLLGFETLVKVWVTVKAEWSQEVMLPRDFNDQRIEIETDIPDRLTISYEGNELDTELTEDGIEVEGTEQ